MALSTTFTQCALETTKVDKNYAKYGPFRRLRSFKVTDFGTNRKLIIRLLQSACCNIFLEGNRVYSDQRDRHT